MNECFVFTQNARKQCTGMVGMCVCHVIGTRNIPSLHLGP